MRADRVVVLDSNPGRIKAELPVVLERSRDRKAPEFVGLVEHIYALMTGRVEQPSTPTADVRRTPASVPLPHASADALSGLAEIMVPLGPLSVAELADELYLEVDDLLPLIDALELLELAQVEAGQMELTPEGQTFAGADIQASKEMFAAAALARAPLVRAL
jgi:NitT/TauT family transport system ATP-binding protein